MPFDGVDPLFPTVALIDAVSAYFADDGRWTQRVLHDGNGRRCLAGAMRHVRRTTGITKDRMRFFIYAAQRRCGIDPGIMGFNDSCSDVKEIRELLSRAREEVMAVIQDRPVKACAPMWRLVDDDRLPDDIGAGEGKSLGPQLELPLVYG